MTTTEHLYKLLDELHKLACDINEEEIRSHSVIKVYQGRYNRQFKLDMNHDWLNAWHTKFERILQAIDITPERETCHCTTPNDAWCFACSACGKSFPRSELNIAHNHGEINYCPNCGAKVVD